MKTNFPTDRPWMRLAKLAAQAGCPAPEMPHGFATRVVARWSSGSGSSEGALALLEWLTLRGLAVALAIFAASAALGYDTVIGVFTGETALVGGWFDSLLTL